MMLEIDTPTFPLIIYVYYSWKEFKSQDLPEPIGRIAQTSWPRRTRFKQIFFSYHEKIPHRGNARLHCCQQLRCPRYSITDVSLPPYRILHQCHQCSSVNRRCNNRPIRGYTGIQKNRRITEEPFFKNVYRRSLALAPTHPPFPPRRFSGVLFYSLPTDSHTLLSERLQQAEVTRVVMSYITYIHTCFIYLESYTINTISTISK